MSGRPEARPGPRRDETARLAAAFALALMVAVSFVPAYQAGFVWDDIAFAEASVVHEVSGLKNIWFSPRDLRNEGHYWPLTYTTFWLEHKLWGLEPAGYHVVNVLLHLCNALLVWRLLRRFSAPGAWIAAAFFCVHPLRVESVVWVIERKDVLSGLFYLASFLAYVRFVDEGGRARWLLALGLFAAGLLSKTVVVTLPAALLIWHWWRRGRVTRRALLRTAPFFAVGLAVALADLAFYRTREILSLDYSFAERILIAGRALWFYAGKTVWPAELPVIYPLWDIRADDPLSWLLVAGAAALPVALWLGRRLWGRGPLVCVAFYAATLSPALGLIDYGYMQFAFVADRFQYLAGIGLLALAAAALVRAADRFPGLRGKSGKVALAAVLAVLGTLTWRHAANFRDELTLFSHIVSLNPRARDAHLNLSRALSEAGRHDESLAASRVAARQRPDQPDSHSNLGVALMNVERFEEAEASLHRALELNPRHRNAQLNLGEAMKRQGRYEEAIERFRLVLEIDGDSMLGWRGLADALFRARRYAQAADAANRALRTIEPEGPDAAALHLLLGRARRASREFGAAERSFLRAAEAAPDAAGPLRELANLYLRMDRVDEAAAYGERASRIEPRSPATLHARAETLRRRNRRDEAAGLYREALELDPENAPATAGLGIVLFELERYEEALASLKRALELDPHLLEASSLHRLKGRALQTLGRQGEAAGEFERALELDPADTEALDHLAFIRFNEADYDTALGLYRALVEADSSNATAHFNLGITLFNLGRYEQAVPNLERSLELEPEQATARAALEDARRRTRAGRS